MDMAKLIDLTGMRFGRLVVVKQAEPYTSPGGHRSARWLCKCDCGNEKIIRHSSLVNGDSTSCGCYQKENMARIFKTHGIGNETRLYRIWQGSKNRCLNPKNRDYWKYGGRGITYYEPWVKDFIAFRDWAFANGYKDSLTLDRNDNDKGYSPDNCRWVSYEIQENNRRNNSFIEIDGVKKTIAQWARYMNVSSNLICDRIKNGWNERDAVLIPKGERR